MSFSDWTQQYNAFFSEGTTESWLAVFVFSLVITGAIKLVMKFISKRLRWLAERTDSIWDDVGVDIVDGLKVWFVFFWLFYIFSKLLNPSSTTHKSILATVVFLSILQIGIWGFHIIRSWREVVLNKKITSDPSSTAAIGLLYRGVQALFLVTVVLIGMSNLGIDIAALLAGLGVGGIAVALAAQNVLGDLLASLSIVLDRPFVVGDFIVAGSEKGTVEYIGIKTTRVRSISGEELILSNKDLLESRIHNFKRMRRRRIVQNFGVVYATSADVLRKIPLWVKEIVEKQERLEFDRCHFALYGDFSLNFELVFFVLDPDYNIFMEEQQKVLLEIYQKFAQEHVEFAFPTQTLHIESLPQGTSASIKA